MLFRSSGLLTLNTLLAEFTGTGTVSLKDVGTGTVITESGSGNATFVNTTKAGGTLTVTYNYTTPSGVPEPVSMVLFGSGLLAVSLIGRKKFARK